MAPVVTLMWGQGYSVQGPHSCLYRFKDQWCSRPQEKEETFWIFANGSIHASPL